MQALEEKNKQTKETWLLFWQFYLLCQLATQLVWYWCWRAFGGRIMVFGAKKFRTE